MTATAAIPSRSINEAPRTRPLAGRTFRPLEAQQFNIGTSKSFEEQVGDTLVALRGAVSQYAMHLTEAQRNNISHQLESIINVDDWYEEDTFPKLTAFRDLLVWSIYAKVPEWQSMGVDDDGDILVAWHTDEVTLTANFDGNRLVRWTSRYQSDGDAMAYASGDCSLRQFARQAQFYLQGGETNVVQSNGR